jgi:hypothetical protein
MVKTVNSLAVDVQSIPPRQTVNSSLATAETEAMEFVKYGIPAAALGLYDTIGATFGVDTDSQIQALSGTAMEGVANYYKSNELQSQVIGELPFMLSVGGIAVKALRGARVALAGTTALTSRPMLQAIMNPNTSSQILRRVAKMDEILASRTGNVAINLNSKRRIAASQAKTSATANAITDGIAFELGVAGTMNESEFLYPSDMSTTDHLMWASLGVVIPGLIEYLITKKQLSNSIRNAAPRALEFLNPGNLPVNAGTRPGQRDVNVVISSLARNDLREQVNNLPSTTSRLENAVGLNADELNAAARRTSNELRTIYEGQRKSLIEKQKKEGFIYANGERETKKFFETAPLDGQEFSTLTDALEKDPWMYLGTNAIQKVDHTTRNLPARLVDEGTILEARGKRGLKSLAKRAKKEGKPISSYPEYKELTAALEKGMELKRQQVVVLEPTGEIVPANKRGSRFYDTDVGGHVIRNPAKPSELGSHTATFKRNGAATTMSMDDHGNLFISGNKEKLTRDNPGPFNSLTEAEQGAAFAMLQRAREEFDFTKAKFDELGAIVIPENAHWTKLQFAYDLLNKSPEAKDWVKLPQGMSTVDDLKYEIFLQKAAGISSDMAKADTSMFKSLNRKLEPHQIFYKFDMPTQGVDGQLSSLGELIATSSAANGLKTYDDFKNAFPSWAHVKKHVQSSAEYDLQQKLGAEMFSELPISGAATYVPHKPGPAGKNSLQKAVVLVKKPIEPNMQSRESLIDYMATQKITIADDLMKRADRGAEKNFAAGTAFVGELGRLVFDKTYAAGATDAFQAAKRIEDLFEFDKMLGGAIGQKVHTYNDVPAMSALLQVTSAWDRRAQEMMASIYRTKVNLHTGKSASPVELFNTIRSSQNKASNQLFNMYTQSRRHGWVISKQPAQLKEGQWAFALDKSNDRAKNANLKIYNSFFAGPNKLSSADDLPDFMPTMSGGFDKGNNALAYKPLVLDDLALDVAESVATLGRTTLANNNVVRRHLGLKELGFREWWIPPKNLTPTDNNHVAYIIPGPGEQAHIISAPTKKQLQTLVGEELAKYHQTGFKQAAELTEKQLQRYHDLQDEVFANMVDMSDALRQTGGNRGGQGQLLLETGDELKNLTESINRQLNSISRRTRGLVFEDTLQYARNMSELSPVSKGMRNVYAQYASDIMGGTDLLPQSLIGRTYGTIETVTDELLSKLHDTTRDWVSANKVNILAQNVNNEKLLSNMRDKIGDNMPFQDAVEFGERISGVSPPPRMKNIAAGLNSVTSLLTLRLFELGHGLLNLTSLASTMPAVTTALKRLPNETKEQWTSRVGAWGTTVGDDVAIMHPVKLFVSSIHETYNNPKYKNVMREAADLGYFRQEVAEIKETLIAPGENMNQAMIGKMIDVLSWPSDTSETLSRSIAHMAFYYLADKQLGMTSESAKHVFAHKQANNVIGDYRPGNKPQIFQGATGMPLGLFQTFMWNYFHRMFSYIENKQYRALTVQYATQAAMFGTQSVPGFQQYNEIFSQNYDGTSNPIDRMRTAFGNDFSDMFFYGALSNLPKLFGAEDGVALYTRGDANVVRIPTIFSLSDTAPARLASTTMAIVRENVDMLRRGGQMSAQQSMEIMGRHFINRPIRNLFELAADSSTDKHGQLIADDIRSGMGIAARMVGAKPMMEAKAIETNYRIRSAELSQRVIRERMRDATRSMIRGGGVNSDGLQELAKDYIESGGRPDYFPRWLQDQLMVSKLTRTEQQFIEFMKNPAKHDDLARMFNMGLLDMPEMQQE